MAARTPNNYKLDYLKCMTAYMSYRHTATLKHPDGVVPVEGCGINVKYCSLLIAVPIYGPAGFTRSGSACLSFMRGP
jgi:hypothetical protein